MGQVISLRADLETVVCWGTGCGIHFAVPQSFMNSARRDGSTFFCPRGCRISIGEGEVKKLQNRLEDERKRREWAEVNEASARHHAATVRGKLKAQSERIANGVCPCCKRSFINLKRHMTTKHPDFAHEEET